MRSTFIQLATNSFKNWKEFLKRMQMKHSSPRKVKVKEFSIFLGILKTRHISHNTNEEGNTKYGSGSQSDT